MSMNALSSTRYPPPPRQQARLNPKVAQQREGVTFTPESREAFEQAAQIIHITHPQTGPDLYAAFREGLGQLIRNSDPCSGEIKLFSAFVMDRLRDLTMNVVISHGGQRCHLISFYIPLETPEKFRKKFDFDLKSLPSPPRLNTQVNNPGIEGVGDQELIALEQTIREYVKTQMPLFNKYVNKRLAPDLLQAIRKDAEALFGEGGANFTLNA